MVRTYEATFKSPREIDIYFERKKPLIKFMYLKKKLSNNFASFFFNFMKHSMFCGNANERYLICHNVEALV